ncbi:ABC transporter ATP-binding protein [Permianibacter aggregans]|uniref:Spermidine/putrescine import ATP-binding protein PotA n=1 Tax=Permianibacter aggregans TaxID=1510150 RepID=A0A4R6UYT9_9GAMM|nr:polyamine ABC transporter ATP-binding protein [Permianibacter aggregans]QGX41365.1 polyamine ABC transporter ATP-binding protein [Permianibacter aggregans]TDQ51153.1 putrescine transport system ATP-binding protein [Permianibacter aggregans]
MNNAAEPHAAAPAKSDENYVVIEGITKRFGDFIAVDNVDLKIRKGEIFALLGSSGCGKSTLLRMLAGFEKPSEGRVLIDGQDMAKVPAYKRPTNMMFQSYALFPHMSVEDNVAFGLKQDGMPSAEIKQRVSDMLALVDMSQFAKRKPHQLSGGQKQRVALARSLAKRPKLLLLDEPMGALDKKLRERMQLELVDIIERVGVTCVMVTHDQEEAMTMASRLGIMSKGRILQVGAPSVVYETPNCRFSAEFIGSVNMFEGTLVVDKQDRAEVAVPELPAHIYVNHGVVGEEGEKVWVAVRPEKIEVGFSKPDRNVNFAKGKVVNISYFGSHSVYHIKLDSGKRVIANASNFIRDTTDRPTWEDEVYLSWEPESAVVLNI